MLRELAIAAIAAPLVLAGVLLTMPLQVLLWAIRRRPWSQTQPHAWLWAQWDAVLDRPYLR